MIRSTTCRPSDLASFGEVYSGSAGERQWAQRAVPTATILPGAAPASTFWMPPNIPPHTFEMLLIVSDITSF
jgi:hypothetical protein